MSKKILKEFIYEGFGFPVILRDVPLKKIRGEWIPFVNYKELTRQVLHFLCYQKEPLTGSQIFFIRQELRMTGEELGKHLGVAQAAVAKWEKKKKSVAKVEPAIQFCIRILVLDHLGEDSSVFVVEYLKNSSLLSEIKEMQKDAAFIPSFVQLEEEESRLCFQ